MNTNKFVCVFKETILSFLPFKNGVKTLIEMAMTTIVFRKRIQYAIVLAPNNTKEICDLLYKKKYKLFSRFQILINLEISLLSKACN